MSARELSEAERVLEAYGPKSGLTIDPLGPWFHGQGERQDTQPQEPPEAA